MQFLDKEHTEPSQMIVEHKGAQLPFIIKTFRSFEINPRTIGPINYYWSLLPMEDQDTIFKLYHEIYNALYTIENERIRAETINRILIELMQYHTFEKMQQFINQRLQIQHPEDILDSIQGMHNNYTEDMTYLRHDHAQLVTLSLMLKVVLPIWGNYIHVLAANKDKTNFEEKQCVLLLRNTGVPECPPYRRLLRYIEATCRYEPSKLSSAALVGGLPEIDIPIWLLYHVLVRKVAGFELYQVNDNVKAINYIVNIYNHTFKLSDSLDKQFGGMISEKPNGGQGGGEEDNASVAENYKIKQEIAEGNIVTHEVFLTNHVEEIIKRIDPTCPVETFYQIKEAFNKHYQQEFQFHLLGMAITKWVLDPTVIANSLENVNYEAVTNAYHMAHTLLNHWGFPVLATLLYAQPREKGHVAYGTKVPITEAQLQQLEHYYPHTFAVPGKRQPSRMDANFAVKGIRFVLSNFYGRWWELNPWDSRQYYNQIVEDLVPLPHDIEYQLAELIITINKRLDENIPNQSNQ